MYFGFVINRPRWLPSGGAVAGTLAACLVFLFIGFPMMVIVMQSTVGCEFRLRPCEPDNTELYVALLVLVLMTGGTWWGVQRLVNRYRHRS